MSDMRYAIFVLSLVCAGSLGAQITASLNRAAERPPELEVRNDARASLTAFAVSLPRANDAAPDAVIVAFMDAVVDSAPLPLATGQKYSIPVPSRYRPRQTPEALYDGPITMAALFADGSTTGDASLLARLVLRRCNLLQAVELARDVLSAAGRHNMPRAQLTQQFQQLADSLNHWYLPQEQQVGRGIYQGIVGRLMGLPDQAFGQPFPPTVFVEQEMASLSKQRTVLMESQPGLAEARR
jgi:hypothetical protein